MKDKIKITQEVKKKLRKYDIYTHTQKQESPNNKIKDHNKKYINPNSIKLS